MGNYTEPQIIETFSRLARIYLESYPDDKEGLDRFMRWVHTQYGDKYGNT